MQRLPYAIQSIVVSIALLLLIQPASGQDLSDNEIKTTISPISDPVKQITALNPLVFEYNTSEYRHLSLPAGNQYGFIAEEFQQVFPALVYKKPYSYMAGKNSYRNATVKSINLEALIPVLIASIKEQQASIDQLRRDIDALKKR